LLFAFPLFLLMSSPSRRDAMREAIGYVRVGSEEQVDSGLCLQTQRQRIVTFCDMKGLQLPEEYEDAGVPGGKPLSSRPSGSRLLLNAAHRDKVVVVAKLDRLFRSVEEAASVIADLDKKGIELAAIAEGFEKCSLSACIHSRADGDIRTASRNWPVSRARTVERSA
jgi:DNA invertase Pin-like site-specific DNA recombinase